MCITHLLAATLFLLQSGPSPKGAPAKEEMNSQSFLEYRDMTRGITFKMDNGRVELTVPNESVKSGESRTATYTAASMEEFKRQYPEIAKKYDIDHYLPGVLCPGVGEKWWNDWWSRFEKDREDLYRRYLGEMPKATVDPWSNLDRWFNRERQVLQDVERHLRSDGIAPALEPKKDHAALFGIQICPVEESLRIQLGVRPHEGFLVAEVQKGSTAEAAGVRKFDVLLKLNSGEILDSGAFRDDIATALKSKEFTLELIRGGHLMTLSVHPAHS